MSDKSSTNKEKVIKQYIKVNILQESQELSATQNESKIHQESRDSE